MSFSKGEAKALRIKEALGAHLIADAYRDAFPDNDADATYLRKQETYWRLTARQWLCDADVNECAERAKRRVAGDPAFKAVVADLIAKLP